MPEVWFRYVAPSRVPAYVALGWRAIGETLSPHNGRPVVTMEWPHTDVLPIEPPGRSPCSLAS